MWFHIKGYPGAHVWIPRGQKNFGAKAVVTSELIEAGCRLALVNSRTKTGSRESGEIEYTERVNLKAQKGANLKGTLLVQRSKTRFIS
jgi:predicted ribosome quality control (RQC) complex YloA/Tae2 family protein